jgi:hypothetical protein
MPRRALPTVPIRQKAEWAPEPVWALWKAEKSLADAGNRSRFLVRPARTRRYNTWAIALLYKIWVPWIEACPKNLFLKENMHIVWYAYKLFRTCNHLLDFFNKTYQRGTSTLHSSFRILIYFNPSKITVLNGGVELQKSKIPLHCILIRMVRNHSKPNKTSILEFNSILGLIRNVTSRLQT